MTDSIDIKKLHGLLENNTRLTLLDVRREKDFRSSPATIPGAARMNPETMDDWAGKVPEKELAVVYCVKGGMVSRSAAERLRQEGKEAVFLEGGIKVWTENGHDTDPSPRINEFLRREDIDLLRDAGLNEEDLNHSIKVARKALEIAWRTGEELDMLLVGQGALFHDLGKAVTHEMEHGKIGAELGRKLGLPKAVTDIMEKHIRGGLTEAEAIELGLPVKDYTLARLEERIIIYADRLVDIITEDIVPIKEEIEAEEQFVEILETIPKYGKNEITMKRYFGYHQEIQTLISTPE
ncbi:MAG: HDIG domain-containing protein [Desulfobacterales bacterium]|nr:HDIG domain-containing protein [Desulfobacterales bacterium]